MIREAPQTVLSKLFKAWNISHLVLEKDTDAYARDRDADVIAQAEAAGVEVIIRMGRTLYDPDELVKANGGKPTMSVTQVQHAAEKIGPVAKPIPAPTSLPNPGDTSLKDVEPDRPDPTPDVNDIQRDEPDESYSKLAGPNDDFAVPTVAELGIKPPTTPHRGGETRALATLEEIISNADYTATFSKPDTAPTAFEPQSTTLLSPHHHFGSLSVRLFYWRVTSVLATYPKAKQSTIPTNLIGQLLFRDMYFAAQASLGPLFAQTHANPSCRVVPWHLPSTIDPTTSLATGAYTIDSPQAEEWFTRWKFGRTGFPWIDALMRQLRIEGWIHHLGRHAVACFLTRGGCYISWERGAAVFEEWLIDHEVACNAGNWQWLSCTAFYSSFFRCYSPVAFPKRTDKQGGFVRRYVPELADYPDKYIYEPWKAPVQDQRRAGCLIRGDGTEGKGEGRGEDGMQIYPKPMFDFNARRTICIDAMKGAYDVHLYGDHAKVLDGTWAELFDDGAEGPTDGAKGKKRGKGGQEASGDMGVDEDEGQAAEEGEGTEKKSPAKGKRKRGGRQQGTLDGAFSRVDGKAKKAKS